MSQEYSVRLANEGLYTEEDVMFTSQRFTRTKTITRYDQIHHRLTFSREGFSFTSMPYPTNIAIQRRSILPNARTAGIRDLRGTDPIWAGVIITDGCQHAIFTPSNFDF